MAKGITSGSAYDESVRDYLKSTLEHLLAAGHSTHELVEFALDKFGRKIIPHLKELQEDIHQGRVKVQSLSDTAKTAVFGLQVNSEQRERMIRDAAYLRAEGRSFAGDSREEDWLWAEQRVDEKLANLNGLLEKGRKNLESVSAIARSELTEVKNAVGHWLEAKSRSGKKAG